MDIPPRPRDTHTHHPAVSSPLNPTRLEIPLRPYRPPRPGSARRSPGGLSPTERLLRQKAAEAWRCESLLRAIAGSDTLAGESYSLVEGQLDPWATDAETAVGLDKTDAWDVPLTSDRSSFKLTIAIKAIFGGLLLAMGFLCFGAMFLYESGFSPSFKPALE